LIGPDYIDDDIGKEGDDPFLGTAGTLPVPETVLGADITEMG
jgi:hypothetical protein